MVSPRGLGALLVLLLTASACSASVCDATAADVAGRWTFATVGGNDDFAVTLDIGEDGQVDASLPGGDALSCELLQDELCDLEVLCTNESNGETVRFTLNRRD